MTRIDYLALLPALIVAGGAVAVLLADAFGASRRAGGLLTLAAAAGAAVALIFAHGRVRSWPIASFHSFTGIARLRETVDIAFDASGFGSCEDTV